MWSLVPKVGKPAELALCEGFSLSLIVFSLFSESSRLKTQQVVIGQRIAQSWRVLYRLRRGMRLKHVRDIRVCV